MACYTERLPQAAISISAHFFRLLRMASWRACSLSMARMAHGHFRLCCWALTVIFTEPLRWEGPSITEAFLCLARPAVSFHSFLSRAPTVHSQPALWRKGPMAHFTEPRPPAEPPVTARCSRCLGAALLPHSNHLLA